MFPRARKILLAAAIFCSVAAAFVWRRRFRPLDGADFRYEIRGDNRVWRLRLGAAAPLENAVVRPVSPEPPYCAAWTGVPAAKGERGGIVLFRGDGQPVAFLPCENAPSVTSLSASPGGRVLAAVKEPRGEIEFFAMPERAARGTILAFGPVLWSDARSGAAFARDGSKVKFTLSPEE